MLVVFKNFCGFLVWINFLFKSFLYFFKGVLFLAFNIFLIFFILRAFKLFNVFKIFGVGIKFLSIILFSWFFCMVVK